MWGSRLAVPLGWQGSTVDDVRALVNAMHQHMEVEFPRDDYFLHVLGTGKLVGRLPQDLDHLSARNGRVVILSSYKIRQPHMDALEYIERNGESVLIKALATMTREIEQMAICECVDTLPAEVRGGIWYWHDGDADDYQTLIQEHRAWVHIGATPRDMSNDIADVLQAIDHMEQKHGGPDPTKWHWGVCTPCADVFAADEAKREHESLKIKVMMLRQMMMTPSSVGVGGARREDRSRSPPPRQSLSPLA